MNKVHFLIQFLFLYLITKKHKKINKVQFYIIHHFKKFQDAHLQMFCKIIKQELKTKY